MARRKRGRPVPGDKFGRLEVQTVYMSEGRAHCQCVCLCTSIWIGPARDLRSGHTRSCGCLHRELCSLQLTTHAGTGTPLYKVWRGMHRRCFNEHDRYYKDYGGRGITICLEWRDFAVFRKWAQDNGYARGLLIDRENNDGNYGPGNCRFVTPQESVCNRRLLQSNNVGGYCGSSQRSRRGVYVASVSFLGQRYSREGFPTAEAAAKFRDALVVVNGWSLPLNFPDMTLEEAQALVGGNRPKGGKKK